MPPAARVGDMHTCPMVDGVKPHVGGPITLGSANVFIGNKPAARVGDMAACVGPPPPDPIAMIVAIASIPADPAGDVPMFAGPPDTIAEGSFTVQIGGKPAARVGDLTAHGGVVTVGCPNVQIG